MQTFGDQLFTRPPFTYDKHRFGQRRDLGNVLQHLQQGIGLTDKIVLLIGIGHDNS